MVCTPTSAALCRPQVAGRRPPTRLGARHGQPLVLVVDAARMRTEGFDFRRSDNGVWLTEVVPAAYLVPLGSHGHGRGPKS
ncbi:MULTISPECIES: RNA 2'-phosphotransferase [Paraburkholderia]|uniref:RNA 2'-phosphotransferase n=1 Tax=Paraburkholderia podalyriae TaxID=1938811 RepID=A0ABR7PQM0_9BURK|nr:hypothetical protein [Paraburkholderia podalyriae]